MNIFKIPKHLTLKNRTMRLMLYTLFTAIVADGIITQYMLMSGLGLEANPFLQIWVHHSMFLAIKISGAFLITLFLWIRYNARPKMVYSVTTLFLGIYTVIVFWNLFVYVTV